MKPDLLSETLVNDFSFNFVSFVSFYLFLFFVFVTSRRDITCFILLENDDNDILQYFTIKRIGG